MNTLALILALILGDASKPIFGQHPTVPDYVYESHMKISAGVLGPTSPTLATNGSVRGYMFDNVNETIYLYAEIPEHCYDGTSNITLSVYFTNEATDAIADTEDIDLQYTYAIIEWDAAGATGQVDKTTTASSGAYTQSGAGGDGDSHEIDITLAAGDSDNPINAGWIIAGYLNRDMPSESNSYSGGVITMWVEIKVPATEYCQHIP